MLPVTSFRNLFWLGLICCLIFLFFSFKTLAQEIPLTPAKKTTIKNGKNTTYTSNINAQRDQVISLEIKQNGMDVKVKLFNPQGLAVAASDYPFSEQDVERIYVIASESGTYRLEITSKFPDEKGSINIKLNELKNALPNDFKHAEAEKLFSQAQASRTTGKTADRKKAIEIFEKSLILWREIGDKIGELRTLTNFSYLYRLLGKYDKTLELTSFIVQFPNLSEYDIYKADALHQTGQVKFARKDYDAAIELFKKSLSLFPNNIPEQAKTWTALGNTYQFTDKIELAQDAFDKALENSRQFPDMYNEALALHQEGLFNFNFNDLEKAVRSLTAAANLRKKLGDLRNYAYSLSLLALSLQSLKRFNESIPFLETALPISIELEDYNNQMDTLLYLIRAYREIKDINKSIEFCDQALNLAEKHKLFSQSMYLSIGNARLQNGDFSLARNYLEKSLENYQKVDDTGGVALTLYSLATLERDEGNYEAAKIKIERVLKLIESGQSDFRNPQRLTLYLANRRRNFDLYIDILMKLSQQRPSENLAFKAMQVSENSRMKTLIWQMREALKNNPQSIDYQLLTQIQKNQQQLGEQFSLLAKAQSNANQAKNISDIEKNIADLNKQDESLKAQLRLSNPNVANLASPPTLSLEQMQAELDDETALVEFSMGEQRSYLWILSKNNFQSFVLPKRAEIEAQAKNVYQILSQSDSPTERAGKNDKNIVKKDLNLESDKLSQMLLVEKFANLSAKRLVFVTDGALNLIPFASLSFTDIVQKKNVFLAEKFETVNLPSLTTLNILRQRNIKPFSPASMAILADPVFAADDERFAKKRPNKKAPLPNDLAATLRDFNLTKISRLPFTRTEAENIAKNAPQEITLNLDFKASRERLLNGEFDHFDILHFATHGFLNNQHPELSGLVLSLVDEKGNQQNGFLRTQDLYLLKINPQMVVLSACQTGLGKQVENEGLIGLTRGFIANGTPRVIATLWKVDDSATAELMARFYRALFKENKKPSAALQTAQNELKAIPRYAHPRYWAGFVLTGEWR